MMTPSIFGESLFDDWMDDFDRYFWNNTSPLYGKPAKNMMKTDVREHDNGYELDIDLPQDADILIGTGEHLQDLRVRTQANVNCYAAIYHGHAGKNQ